MLAKTFRAKFRKGHIEPRDPVAFREEADLMVTAEEIDAEARSDETPEDIWVGYDPEQVRAALRESAGALKGVDREALLRDIHAAREQESRGRHD